MLADSVESLDDNGSVHVWSEEPRSMPKQLQFPKYEEIEEALFQELRRRGGSASPSDHDGRRRTVYEALADRFRLSQEARDAVIYEKGIPRSKWDNMVRWAARKLKDHAKLVRGLHGI